MQLFDVFVETKEWVYCYGCSTKLKTAGISVVHVPKISLVALVPPTPSASASGAPLPPQSSKSMSEGRSIMEHLLRLEGRCLTEEQWLLVEKSLRVLGTAFHSP